MTKESLGALRDHAGKGPEASPVEHAAQRIVDSAVRLYPSRVERVAMRGALGDAAAFCDVLAEDIARRYSHHGRVTILGKELVFAVKTAGDGIWAMRSKIAVTAEQPASLVPKGNGEEVQGKSSADQIP